MNYIDIVNTLYNIYYWVIIIYIFMSWMPQARESQIGEMIGKITEPYLSIFRRIIPPIGMIDISPIVALIALFYVKEGILFILSFLLGGITL